MATEEQDRKLSAWTREAVEAAMDDPHRDELQLYLLNRELTMMSTGIRAAVRDTCSKIFNGIRYRPEDNKNDTLIELLTTGEVGLKLNGPIKIDPGYADFSPAAILELNGYKKLHEEARKADVAINISGLTTDEGGMPPKLTIDVNTSYENGELRSTYGYPELPELDAEPQKMLASGPPVIKPPKRFDNI